MTRLTDYINKRVNHPDQFNAVTPQPKEELPEGFVQTPQDQQQQSYPVVDSSNAIGSLADLLGPTPAEREAQERRMLENKNKMQTWIGLFDGLRQLGNLYFTAKGASPQNLTSTAPVIEQQYQQQRNLYNDLINYRRQYNTSLYNLQRQTDADKRAAEKHKAEMGWYDTRSEVARAKADNDAIKAEAYSKAQEAKANNDQAKAAFYEEKAKALEEGLPYDIAIKRAKEAQARASANYSNARAANVGAETETTRHANPDGSTTINKRTVRNTGASSPAVNKSPNSTQKISTGVNWKKRS